MSLKNFHYFSDTHFLRLTVFAQPHIFYYFYNYCQGFHPSTLSALQARWCLCVASLNTTSTENSILSDTPLISVSTAAAWIITSQMYLYTYVC